MHVEELNYYMKHCGFLSKTGGEGIEEKKDGFVEDFSLTARTAFLLMKAYNTPKFARDIAEFCHTRPEAALRHLLEDLIGLLGCLWQLSAREPALLLQLLRGQCFRPQRRNLAIAQDGHSLLPRLSNDLPHGVYQWNLLLV